MNLKEFQDLQSGIVEVLKTRFTNMSTNEALVITNKIIDKVINVLNLERK